MVRKSNKRVRCFNTQPPEGGWSATEPMKFGTSVSTHSRPKAAVNRLFHWIHTRAVSTHSRPKAAVRKLAVIAFTLLFQHTAARRRLVLICLYNCHMQCFNTQPPEGGCCIAHICTRCDVRFQHTAARRRLDNYQLLTVLLHSFNTQPPEGGWCYITPFLTVQLGFNTQPPEGG